MKAVSTTSEIVDYFSSRPELNVECHIHESYFFENFPSGLQLEFTSDLTHKDFNSNKKMSDFLEKEFCVKKKDILSLWAWFVPLHRYYSSYFHNRKPKAKDFYVYLRK